MEVRRLRQTLLQKVRTQKERVDIRPPGVPKVWEDAEVISGLITENEHISVELKNKNQ